MALVKVEKNTLASTWNNKEKKAANHKAGLDDVERPVIDYGRLKELLSIEGLSDSTSTDDAHRQFIDGYKSVFVQPEKLTGLPIHSLERSMRKGSHSILPVMAGSKSVGGPTTTDEETEEQQPVHPVDKISHDIREHTAKLRVKSRQEKKQMEIQARVKSLRQLIKKLPYERTAAETDEIHQHLSHFPEIADQVSSTMLRELCVMSYLETWNYANVPVFGNTGWHILLKGTMRPQQIPWKKFCSQEVYFPNPSPEPLSDLDVLGVGESFGTLEKVPDRDGCSRILNVITLEPNCEFLKIATGDFERVSKQLSKRDETEKINLLQSCSTFAMWAQQPIARSDSVNRGHPLVKVASVLEWATYPANTILVSEGYHAPFIGIIKSGECHVLREVEVVHNSGKGKVKTEKKMKQVVMGKKIKQVVMGKLGQHKSFGEVSLTEQKPMSCSIITSSKVELGYIGQDKLSELDETTKRLLHQSSEPTFGNLSKDDIHREYVEQESKREWNEFKHKVVLDVINARGVKPGYGKWAK